MPLTTPEPPAAAPQHAATDRLVDTLSDRQAREREYYRAFVAQRAPTDVDFGPVAGRERRPWNSYWRFFEVLRALYHPGARLLDFGCGCGHLSACAAHVGYTVEGFDLSPESVAVARRLLDDNGLGARVQLHVGTAESLKFDGGSFDVVAGLDILHHVELDDAVRECLRVLRPGGTALFREPLVVPMLDALRHSALVRWLAPATPSIEHHITADERKLTPSDLRRIRALAGNLTIERFDLLSRAGRLLGKRSREWLGTLQRWDYRLMRAVAPVRALGGSGVLRFTRDAARAL